MKRLSLNAKVMLIVTALCGVCFVIGGMGLRGMSVVQANTDQIVKVIDHQQSLWMKMRVAALTATDSEREYFASKDADAHQKFGARVDEEFKNVNDALTALESAVDSAGKAKIADAKKAAGDLLNVDKEVRGLADKGDVDGARTAYNNARSARAALSDLIKAGYADTEKAMSAKLEEIGASYTSTRNSMIVVGMLALGGAILLSFLLFEQLRRAINAVVKGLASNSEQVEAASIQVSDSAHKLSQSSTEQAASLQQTAASTQQLTSMVQRNLENAKASAGKTETSQRNAQRGKQVVEEMAKAITEIDKSNQAIMAQVNDSNAKISEITKVIAEIGNKTKVINDIVFQTKLLSFNASVEAARAGEHGKGFAVVAEEVGNLARMSGEAAKGIGTLLESSIQKVEDIVNETKTNVERLVTIGKQKVEAGARIAQECSGVLDEIVDNVSDVNKMSTDIRAASEEQAQGVSEISRAMGQLDYVTQTNASAAHQAASAASHLSDQAKSLKSTVADLLAIVEGAKSDHDHSASRQAASPVAVSASPSSAPEVAKSKSTAMRSQAPVKSSTASSALKASKPAPTGKPRLEVVKAGSKPAAKAAATKPAAPKASPAKTAKTAQAGQAAPAPAPAPAQPLKLAAGGEVEIPSEDDPRFKDV